MSRRRPPPAVLLLASVMLACAVPGLSAAPTSVPADAADRLGTMVAATVSAARQETRTAQPGPTSTPTPTAAFTAEAESSAAAGGPAQGTSLSLQDDGTTLFLDDPAGYQVNVPPGWLPLRVTGPEYYDAFSLPIAAEPAVQRALMEMRPLDPQSNRLVILDLQEGHLHQGVVTRAALLWDPDGSLALEDEQGLLALAEALSTATPGLAVTGARVSTTSAGIRTGTILSEVPDSNDTGEPVVLFQERVYVNLEAGLLVISLSTESEFKDEAVSRFDSMIESLRILSG